MRNLDVDGLIRALRYKLDNDTCDNECVKVRSDAAKALGDIGNTRAVDALTTALEDPAKQVRLDAVVALGRICDAQVMDPLIAALGNPDWQIRIEAVTAIGHIHDARAIAPLTTLLQDPTDEVRRKAVWALGQIGEAGVIQPITAALEDPVWKVRLEAVAAIGGIHDARAIGPLTIMLEDPDWHVRWQAADSLGNIGHPVLDPLAAAGKDPAWQAQWDASIEKFRGNHLDEYDNNFETVGSNYYPQSGFKYINESDDICFGKPINFPCNCCGKKPSRKYTHSINIYQLIYDKYGYHESPPPDYSTGAFWYGDFFCDNCASWGALDYLKQRWMEFGDEKAMIAFVEYGIRTGGFKLLKRMRSSKLRELEAKYPCIIGEIPPRYD